MKFVAKKVKHSCFVYGCVLMNINFSKTILWSNTWVILLVKCAEFGLEFVSYPLQAVTKCPQKAFCGNTIPNYRIIVNRNIVMIPRDAMSLTDR